MRRLRRRELLAGLGLLPLILQAACDGDDTPRTTSSAPEAAEPEAVEPTAAPAPTATPEPPFIITEAETSRLLMPGTPYETVLRIFGSGVEGQIILVLGGVHGNEPGGWLAAEQVAAELRPAAGGLLVLPRANRVAIDGFVRTTDELGDLNRLYPGDPAGLPMAVMAYEIVQAVREFHVSLVLDLHESWAFYRDRTDTQTGTAFLGQTISSFPGEPGVTLAREIAAGVNRRIQAPHEELIFRERSFRSRGSFDSAAGPMRFGSSMSIPSYAQGTSAILVEMGQQQPLERRVALHVDVVREAMRLTGVAPAGS